MGTMRGKMQIFKLGILKSIILRYFALLVKGMSMYVVMLSTQRIGGGDLKENGSFPYVKRVLPVVIL